MIERITTDLRILEERVAEMEALGAIHFWTTPEEAELTDSVPGDWIGTEGHQWLVASLPEMDAKHWKQTLRELNYSLQRAPADK